MVYQIFIIQGVISLVVKYSNTNRDIPDVYWEAVDLSGGKLIIE